MNRCRAFETVTQTGSLNHKFPLILSSSNSIAVALRILRPLTKHSGNCIQLADLGILGAYGALC